MKKTLLISCALLALAAPTVFADANGGLDFSSVACNKSTSPLPSNVFTLDCSAGAIGTPQELYANFSITAVQDSFVGLNAAIDLIVNSATIPPWWDMSASGPCNGPDQAQPGVGLTLARNSLICVGSSNIWTGNFTGGIAFGQTGANRGEFGVVGARSTPFKLLAATNYYGFTVQFFTDNAAENGTGTCAGCTTGANLVWNSLTIANQRAASQIGPEAAPFFVTGPGTFGNCVTINNGAPGGCAATPTKSKTWGQLKSLYR